MNRDEINAMESAWRLADQLSVHAPTADARLAAEDAAEAILTMMDQLAGH